MTTKYIGLLLTLAAVSLLSLVGAAPGTGERMDRTSAREPQTRSRDAEFLARYYEQGASAGSTWEGLTERPEA